MEPGIGQPHFFRLGLTGYPLGHSLSPAIHNAAIASAGLQGEYCLYPVSPLPSAPQALSDLLDRLRHGELDGLNVTIPHKQAVLPLLDWLEPAARRIGAANLLYCRRGQLVGDNTDATGFYLDLRHFLQRMPLHDQRALVLGAGGAARAVAAALLDDGWQITLAARRLEQAQALAHSLLPARFTVIPLVADSLANVVGTTLLVNATPLGMSPNQESCPWPVELALPAGAAVYDLVYNPPQTCLMRRAQAAGLPAAGGLGMLVEQAALSFERWTGRPAPRPAMRQAVGLA